MTKITQYVSNMILNYHVKKQFERSSLSGDILCETIKQSDFPMMLGPNSKTRLLNYLKRLNQFAAYLEAYPYVQNKQ